MGVKGLTSMIEQHPSLFTRHCLHDARLVIDGNALKYFLYQDRPPCDNGHHGGRYQIFSAKCQRFFLNLAECNISPYLVFDGALEMDDKKLAETKSRSQERIRTAVAIPSGSGGIAVSPCSALVFMKVLDDLGIPYVFCDFEADAETAALANALDCAAASGDSDFYIMDLRDGYLPLNHFDWMNPKMIKVSEAAAPSGQLYIECKKYKSSAFCKMFHVKQTLLPILATAVGNDYKDTFGASLDPFQSFVHSKFFSSKTGRRSYDQIVSYLSWLKEKETKEEAIYDMVRHVRGADREKLRRLIDASLEMYHFSDSLTVAHFTGGQLNPKRSKLAACASVPPWFVDLLNRGKVAAMCANVLCNKRVFLKIQVEDSRQVSAGGASLNIRAILYGILLKGQKSASRRPPVVEEYAQSSGSLKHSIVEPAYDIAGCDGRKLALPSLQDIPDMYETDRREILLAAAGIGGSVILSIPALFQLATCVTLNLLSHANPPVYSDQIVALLVSWLHGVAASRQKYINKDQDTPKLLQVDLENSDMHAILTNCKPHENKYEESRQLDVEVIQAMAQWQQCLLDLVHLNKVLLSPFVYPDMAVLYNGPLIHSLCIILKPMSSTEQQLQWVVRELLGDTMPGIHALLDQLLKPLSPFLMPRKRTNKSKKGKKAPSRPGTSRPSMDTPPARGAEGGAERDTEEVFYSVRVSNRFAALGWNE
ncbi:protein asteroid homolog 1-like [Patiria miniata]|uniref:XPG N-terminal domain-containing protein n=1 Tax=Patiria miniata TaxID=46514 RepID=A0A914AUA2_PATMI|nr:protein asteroid homolog 1-like [Patiria miniata]